MKYRILIEHDENGQAMESIAIYNTETEKIEKWVGYYDKAIEYIETVNGTLAVLDF